MREDLDTDALVADRARRAALIRMGAYAALTPPTMLALLSTTKSAAFASSCTRQNPGNDKCVGNAPFDGVRGEEPSGKPKKN